MPKSTFATKNTSANKGNRNPPTVASLLKKRTQRAPPLVIVRDIARRAVGATYNFKVASYVILQSYALDFGRRVFKQGLTQVENRKAKTFQVCDLKAISKASEVSASEISPDELLNIAKKYTETHKKITTIVPKKRVPKLRDGKKSKSENQEETKANQDEILTV